jgi:hypothetical protein
VLTGSPSPRAGGPSRRQQGNSTPPTEPAAKQAKTTPEQAEHDAVQPAGQAPVEKTNAVFRGDTGASGLGVEIRDPKRLEAPTPIQGKPPAPPTKLNPEGWLEGADKVDE